MSPDVNSLKPVPIDIDPDFDKVDEPVPIIEDPEPEF
jgi:hypothetical protein